MSTGMRIAQKRKELGLSQEALGDRMGVSRQAIYKWESDAALPEVEKLVALSKLFGVSVGWLLGVEEETDTEQQVSDELTPAQLKMVSEIVDRYIASQPKPKPRRKWPWVLAACVLVWTLIQMAVSIDRLTNQYLNLQNSVNGINSSVNSQIGGIANRVEEILNAQNSLTAEFDAWIIDTDYRDCTVTLAMKAVPKTYVDGMSAAFVVDCGAGAQEFTCELSDGTTFTAEATVTLTDSITASVVFIASDGTRQTQVLDSYSYLLSDSYAGLNIHDDLMHRSLVDGDLVLRAEYVYVSEGYGGTDARITDYRIGIFRNQQLLSWAEKCEKPANYSGFGGYQFFLLPELTVEDLGKEDTIQIAALVTDSYGRQYMICDVPYCVEWDDRDGTAALTWVDIVDYDRDPGNWTFD